MCLPTEGHTELGYQECGGAGAFAFSPGGLQGAPCMGLWQLILMHCEKHFSFLFVLGCPLLPEAGQAP